MLPGLLLLLLFQVVGEAIKIGTGTVIPGPVLGLLLMLGFLLLRRGVPDWLERGSNELLGQLGLLFMPPAVGLIFIARELEGQWPAILAAVLGGTFLTLCACGLLLQWLVRRQERREGRRAAARR
jgi:holin-like protein